MIVMITNSASHINYIEVTIIENIHCLLIAEINDKFGLV